MSKKRKPIRHVVREDYPRLMARSVVRGHITVRKPGDLYLGIEDEPELVHPAEVEALNKQARSAAALRQWHDAQRSIALLEAELDRLLGSREWDDAGVKRVQFVRRELQRLRQQPPSS